MPSWLWWLVVGCIGSCRVEPPGDSADTSDRACTDQVDDTAPVEHAESFGVAEHAVILVLDGARMEESLGEGTTAVDGVPTEEYLPEIRQRVLPHGTRVHPGVASGVTITAEGHAELLTGARLPLGNFPSDDGPGVFRPDIPTVYETLRSNLSLDEEQVALVVNTVHLEGLRWSLYPSLGEDQGSSYEFLSTGEEQPVDSDLPVIEAVQAHMESHDTRLVVANLHDMDRAGHYGGPTAYPEDVQVVDEPIAQFWEWIQSSETYADRTVLVLVADHGRHRWDEDEDWRNHGDQCAGCREIPMFMAGPGIRTDTTVTEPYTLVDVGRTVAWLLGVELPYSTGRLMCDVLTDDPDGNPTGQVHPAISGSLYATQQWAIDDGTVTQVVIDGEVLSSELALHAEAPVLLSTEDHEFACWRELVLGTGTIEDWAWQGECRHREPGGAWTDLEFPDDAVWPFWKPSLEMDDGGRLWVAYVDNQNGGTSSGQDVAVRVLRWTSSRGWEGAEYGNDTVYYPTSLSMKLVEDGALIAFARSSGTVRGRYTRHVEVNHVTWTSAQQPTWARALITQTLDQQTHDTGSPETGTAPEDATYARLEAPALHVDGEQVLLAYLAYDEAGLARVILQDSDDAGTNWSRAQELDDSSVLAHVEPTWSPQGTLYWARLSGTGTVELCRYQTTDEQLSCVDSEKTYIHGLAASESQVQAGLGDGRIWNISEVTW